VDERTRYTVVKELQSKDQCVSAFKEAIDDFARIPGVPIKVGEGSILHGDSERVLQSKNMHKFLAERCISPRASPPYTHERNGIAERQIRTLFDMVRSLLQQADLPNKLWFLALQHAAYIRNRVPSSALDGLSPLQVLTGKVSEEVVQLKRFGCTVFVLSLIHI
jgi:transposase InsO family protein